MPTLLMNLRQVPDDEADEIRELLTQSAVTFFETPPSRFGISAGSIWLGDDAQRERAVQLLAQYQQQRRERARDTLTEAQRAGHPATFWALLRSEPLRVVSALIVIVVLIGLCLLPYFLLRD